MSAPRDARAHGLERLLSKAGLCSRAQARAWIRAGRVRVDGRVALDPDEWVDPSRSRVLVDGRPLAARAKLYYALHKPSGYLTTRSDPGGRPTVYDLVAGEVPGWVIAVGRLDRDTSGLLLLSNDTAFAEHVTNPASHVEKRYRVLARPALAAEALARLAAGVELEDGPTLPARVERARTRGGATELELVIREGRNRQVRRMVAAVGSRVRELARTAIGPVELGDLALGAVRELSPREVASLSRGGPPPGVTRRRSSPS